MRVRARGEDIRRFILNQVENHPNDVTKIASERFHITRQAVRKHLKRLVHEKSLEESGETRQKRYRLAPLVAWQKTYSISPALEEYILWDQDVAPILQPLPENVMDIWHYGFTEMVNNAKDHSDGSRITVRITKTAVSTDMMVSDDGIGIFKKIQQAFSLPDQRYAILELSKGKLTTDPSRHTGEGIFFSSRMFDHFSIGSDKTWYGHKFGVEADYLGDWNDSGTAVFMELGNHTSRTEKAVFDQYAGDGDYGFNKTVVPVELAQYGNDKLISRSQAKRVVARLELFKTIVFDFNGVPSIGQAFADEIFRVFGNEHPEVALRHVNANPEVARMIERVMNNPSPVAPLPIPVTDDEA